MPEKTAPVKAARPTPDDVIAAAKAYDDVRWHDKGRSRAGMDCAGLLILVGRDLGLENSEALMGLDWRRYGSLPPNILAAELVRAGLRRAAGPRPGQVAMFAGAGSYPTHVGIVGHRELIHASAEARKVVVTDWTEHETRACRGFFEHPGIEYAPGAEGRPSPPAGGVRGKMERA